MPAVTRRELVVGLAAATSIAILPSARAKARKTLVILRLRGAMDGLGAVYPFGDAELREARAALALAHPGERNGVIDLDGRLGLHPALETLAELYRTGELIVVPAFGTGYQGCSHKDAQAFMDAALPSCCGAAGEDQPDEARHEPGIDVARDLAERHPQLASRILGPLGLAPALFQHSMRRHAAFLRSASTAGASIAAGAGGVLALDCFGWDTHASQGAAAGRLGEALTTLDQGIARLRLAAGERWRDAVVLAVTEFGRSVRMNAAGGTDHGGASAAFLCGGAVRGRRILGEWPAPTQGRMIEAATDLRALASGLCLEMFGTSPVPRAPGGPPPLLGLTRS